MCIHLGDDNLVSKVIILGDRQHKIMCPSTRDGKKSMASEQISE